MKKIWFSIAFTALVTLGGTPAALAAGVQSISFCKCCGETTGSGCEATCAGEAAAGECPVTVSFGGEPSSAENQLNGISLKELDLGKPSRAQLEGFRKFLEKERRKAQAAILKNERAYNKHNIGDTELQQAKARFDEAMVNYNHGIYAYQVAAGTRE